VKKKDFPNKNICPQETQRLCNLLPINLSHRTTEPVKIGGQFHIGKGVPILPQIGNVLADERVFPEADKFRPERFLDTQGRMKKCEELVPFGIGKRLAQNWPIN
jgi:cytochrome P450 family 33